MFICIEMFLKIFGERNNLENMGKELLSQHFGGRQETKLLRLTLLKL